VGVEVDDIDDLDALKQDFRELTGFRLVASQSGENGSGSSEAFQPETTDHMEINAAYGIIRDALEPLGLSKAGLKQNQIVLTFVSPQVGERHRETIVRLAEETGYPLVIHPHPNQQQIMQIVQTLVREAGWRIRKGPGLHTDRSEVSMTLMDLPDEAEIARVGEAIESQTGYRLVVAG
jgi:hypothetical protein